MIVLNAANEVLLVRHSYVDEDIWTIPGGSIARMEDPIAAGKREIREEMNCELQDPVFFEFEQAEYWGCRYDTYLITAFIRDNPEPDMREVIAAEFFSLDNLPTSLQPIQRARIERFKEKFGFLEQAGELSVNIPSAMSADAPLVGGEPVGNFRLWAPLDEVSDARFTR